jgi:hypothetical protein
MPHPILRDPTRRLRGSRTVNSVNCPTALSTDGAAVLLRYDLVADRQPESGAFVGRLGRKERLEQFIPVFRRNTDTIVTHPEIG